MADACGSHHDRCGSPGVNRCCGAGLTPEEAAAAAGRLLGDVVAALDVAGERPA